MENEIEVRPATLAELAFAGQDGYVATPILQRKIAEQEVFVASLGGELVGYLRLEHLWSQVPYIALVRVMPPFRRRGVGRALLKEVCERARAQGHRALYSSSTANEAEPQAWHRHMGFEECGLIAGINDGVGELFFRKAL